jgi:hypothetical protein
MCDDVYYYRDRVRELETAISFNARNSLLSIISKLEWIKENGGGIDHAIEHIKSKLKDS